jgi:tetratricopeptide (TPR) repeat protein
MFLFGISSPLNTEPPQCYYKSSGSREQATDTAEAYLEQAMTYEWRKQYPEALAAYEKCIALEPTGVYADEARWRISKSWRLSDIRDRNTAQPAEK